jgi:hypothetical protein
VLQAKIEGCHGERHENPAHPEPKRKGMALNVVDLVYQNVKCSAIQHPELIDAFDSEMARVEVHERGAT